METCLS